MKHKIAIISVAVAIIAPVVFTSLPAHAVDIQCGVLDKSLCASASSSKDIKTSGVSEVLKMVIQVMTGGVGLVAVASFVYAGILYSSAGGTSDRVAQSKKIMTNTTIGLILFALMLFALNWLIPGGVFG